jgi:hypothetical protein
MASIINVDQIRNAAGTSGITLDASTGKASFPNGVTLPAGNVIQTVIFDSVASSVSGQDINNTTSKASTRTTVSITPKFSNSLLVVTAIFNGKHDGTGSGSVWYFYRDGSELNGPSSGHMLFYSTTSGFNGANKHNPICMRTALSAGSTSSTTFTIYQRAFDSVGAMINYDWGYSTLEVQEIAQ